MLYQRWLHTVSGSPDRLALWEMATGRCWSFAQLAALLGQRRPLDEPVAYPQGSKVEFILDMLQAWRDQRMVCPLEPGQRRDSLGLAAHGPLGGSFLQNTSPVPTETAPMHSHDLPPDIVHLKSTSATTGLPRLVAFTAAQLAADAENIVATMGLTPDWPNLGVISLAHSYGFSNLVLPLVLHGVPLILAESPLPESLRKAGAQHTALTLPGVPALWRTWHDARAIPPNIMLAISAGAPLPPALEREVFAGAGLKIHNFYGSSETGGIAYDATSVPREDPSFVGKPMVNVSVSVAADRCIEVRGAAVGQTYWPEPSPDLDGGRFKTSDLGEVLGGAVYLRGRAGEQINVAGRKFSPEQVERVLAEHPAVKDCIVFGHASPSKERGEMVVACVVPDEEVTAETLRQFLATRIPAWQLPRDWWFLSSLEASQRGKISRGEWKNRYAERRLQGRLD